MRRRIVTVMALGLLAGSAALWWLIGNERSPPDGTEVIRGGSSAPGPFMLPRVPAAAAADSGASGARATEVETSGRLASASRPVMAAAPVAFTGWLVDARGEPLAGHAVRLSRTASAASAPQLEATATSERDGRFLLRDVQPGSKLLEVRGPGEGDLPLLVSDRKDPSDVRIGFSVPEGSLYLTLAPEGLLDVYVMAARHAAFWVHGLVELEPAPDAIVDAKRRFPSVPSQETWLQDPAEPLPPWQEYWRAPRRPDPELRGLVLKLNWPESRRDVMDTFLAGADEPGHTLLVLHSPGFEAAVRQVDVDAEFEHVGTISMSRVAQLVLRVVDADTQQELEQASFEVKETGGGQPDRVTRGDLSGYFDIHDCDRRLGRYELRVTADGYRPWDGSGDLFISENGVPASVELVRAE